jgi:acetyl esterase/lipase
MPRINNSHAGPSPLDRYVNPGMQSAAELAGLPPAIIVTNGFDPLRDVGIEYAQKLTKAGVRVTWHHHDDLIHGWVQMSAWAQGARDAAREVGEEVRRLLYGTVVSEA